jgi:hypothetical protein
VIIYAHREYTCSNSDSGHFVRIGSSSEVTDLTRIGLTLAAGCAGESQSCDPVVDGRLLRSMTCDLSRLA